jgi:ribosomal protein L11 methyltransferase
MKTYKEFKVTTAPFEVDTVSGMLWQLDIDGINEFDNFLTVFVNENKQVLKKNIEDVLSKLVHQKLIDTFTVEESVIEDRNWNEEYEKKVRVIEVTDRIVINFF